MKRVLSITIAIIFIFSVANTAFCQKTKKRTIEVNLNRQYFSTCSQPELTEKIHLNIMDTILEGSVKDSSLIGIKIEYSILADSSDVKIKIFKVASRNKNFELTEKEKEFKTKEKQPVKIAKLFVKHLKKIIKKSTKQNKGEIWPEKFKKEEK